MKLMGKDTNNEFDEEEYTDYSRAYSKDLVKSKSDKVKIRECKKCHDILKDTEKHVPMYKMVQRKIGSTKNSVTGEIENVYKAEKQYSHCELQVLFEVIEPNTKKPIKLWNPRVPTYKEVKLDEF